MKLSLICLNYSTQGYNTAPSYHTCLEKIFQSVVSFPIEVIMVDNGSPNRAAVDGLKAQWQKQVRFVQLPRNAGYHGGNQAGIEASTGEYILTINGDAELFPDTLETLVSYMDSNPTVGLAGPQLIYPDGTIQDSYRNYMNLFDVIIKRLRLLHNIPYFKARMHHYLMWNVNPQNTMEVDWIVGNCMCFRREAYEAIGGYDHRYFLFMGDTDICRTMWKHGWKVIYLPTAKATHQKSRLSGNRLLDAVWKKTFWIHISDFFKYMMKWIGRPNPRTSAK